MAISSAMYAAVTGLSALGAGMQTISNNIANVNTVGFKAGRTNYEDLLSQNYFSGGRVNQRGTGVKVSTIQSMFTQGAFMSSAQDTDMAIAGEGFFSVRNAVTGSINYTRAGVFTMTKEGLLEDPSGNILQGWQMSIPKPGQEAVRIGVPTDVKVTVLNAPPVASSQMKVVTNLDAGATSTYDYDKYELAVKYATDAAVPIATEEMLETIVAIYPTKDGPTVELEREPVTPLNTPANPVQVVSSLDDIYDLSFLNVFNDTYGSATVGLASAVTQLQVVHNSYGPLTSAQHAAGLLTEAEYNQLKIDATGPVAVITSAGQVGHFTSSANITSYSTITGTGNVTYDNAFIAAYNSKYGTSHTSISDFKVVDSTSQLNPIDPLSYERRNGFMTEYEFSALAAAARAEARAEATAEGRRIYDIVYDTIYTSKYDEIVSMLQDWRLEGDGFAGAWNAQEIPPIDPENYVHNEPIKIYDTLGQGHDMHIYYQPNPHMDNVWDYIITCDPIEDARKDANNNLLLSDTASFSGLIQKGKITFTADGKDRHGGMIKDIEAQNVDLANSKMATIGASVPTSGATVTMRNATIGGYFKGSPNVDPITGQQVSSERAYTVKWGGNVKFNPATSGMVWEDSLGNTGIIPIYERQHAGPYEFGSGMTITFDQADLPLHFGTEDMDAISFTAHSEQIAWTNLEPNKEGYFDFDVAFVQSASMALHPPYPEGMPTIYQKIALDMGAKNPYGLSSNWTLDEQSTTQYDGKSNTVFANSDGYPSGSLQRVSIGEDGVLTGVYSNGRQQPLYQIGLTRFLNPWGLSKIGDNLFAETRHSGEGVMNEPGTAGNGTILSNFLEQSNVDLAEEIVNMIITQRGFQANSKTVTTTDTMLAEVIEMKR